VRIQSGPASGYTLSIKAISCQLFLFSVPGPAAPKTTPPFDFTAQFLARRAVRRGEQTIVLASKKSRSPIWCSILELVRTHFFEKIPPLSACIHAQADENPKGSGLPRSSAEGGWYRGAARMTIFSLREICRKVRQVFLWRQFNYEINLSKNQEKK